MPIRIHPSIVPIAPPSMSLDVRSNSPLFSPLFFQFRTCAFLESCLATPHPQHVLCVPVPVHQNSHCRQFKPNYVSLAQEVLRRSIVSPVTFYAVSCELYREVCRAYDVKGFPLVLGYGRGMDIKQRGFQLNKEGIIMTADIIGGYLGLQLAYEERDATKLNLTSTDQKKEFANYARENAERAVTTKAERQAYKSTINERFHNAATSLAFVLKSGVFVESGDELEDKRAMALQEFMELADWALPQSWHVRTGLVQDVLGDMVSIVEDGPRVVIDLVEKHQSMHVLDGLWGDLHLKGDTSEKLGLGGDAPKSHGPPKDPDAPFWANIKYTEACTHNERGMGFTCGLWDLLHILSIGASVPIHRVYGFRSGYHVAPLQVAEVMKRFISNFFACDVCRWNFVKMYERGGHRLHERLVDTMPELTDKSTDTQTEIGKELAIWLWEVHNSINVRIMREQAIAQHRNVTKAESLAAVFPPKELCPHCWHDDTLTTYDREEVFIFLKRWYWYVGSVWFGAVRFGSVLFPDCVAYVSHEPCDEDEDWITLFCNVRTICLMLCLSFPLLSFPLLSFALLSFPFLHRVFFRPRIENSERGFQTVARGRLTRLHQIQTKWETHWQIIGPVGIIIALVLRRFLNKSAEKQRKSI